MKGWSVRPAYERAGYEHDLGGWDGMRSGMWDALSLRGKGGGREGRVEMDWIRVVEFLDWTLGSGRDGFVGWDRSIVSSHSIPNLTRA